MTTQQLKVDFISLEESSSSVQCSDFSDQSQLNTKKSSLKIFKLDFLFIKSEILNR